MFKLLGSVLIITAFSLRGLSKSVKLKKRSDLLLRIISALHMLETEISYGQKDIKTALLSVGTLENMPIFVSVSEKIGDRTVYGAFSETLSGEYIELLNADKLTLLEFSQSLGSLETDSQIKSIIHTEKLLSKAQSEAYEEYKKYGRLYKNMGLLLGILVSLILF